MRRLLLVLMSMLFVSAMAQDVLIMRNGDEIQCKVLEISKSEVKFKRWSNPDGPVMAEKKSDIFMIKYENGEKEMIKAEETTATATQYLSTPALSFTPLAHSYLEYNKRSKSGIKMFGQKQSITQAKEIFGGDWSGFRKAKKEERGGRITAIASSAFFATALVATALHISYSVDYNDYIKQHEDNKIIAQQNWQAEGTRLLDEWKYAMLSGNDAEAEKAKSKYENFKKNKNWNSSEFGYDFWLEVDIEDKEFMKKASIGPMVTCYTLGATALIIGIIKHKRGKAEVTRFINHYNNEYERINKSSMLKPEFDIKANSNGLAFSVKF